MEGAEVPKVWQRVSVAFSPVVTMAWHLGISLNRAGISVGVKEENEE